MWLPENPGWNGDFILISMARSFLVLQLSRLTNGGMRAAFPEVVIGQGPTTPRRLTAHKWIGTNSDAEELRSNSRLKLLSFIPVHKRVGCLL